MKKHFYHNLIAIETIETGLIALDLDDKEKKELMELANNNIHHAVLDAVLSELSEDDKKTFLSLVVSEAHDDIWKMLTEKIENAQEKIKKTANDLIAKLHEDIKEAHSKK